MHSPIPRQSFDHLEELEFVISLNTLISQATFVKLPNSVEQSAEAISRNARGLPRLRLAMTGKGDNDKARKQCVTNHMNEHASLTWVGL